MDSSELAASSVNLENSIVFSAGCHSGYNIVDGDAIPNVTQPIDWVQAFAQKQATVIAGTGYQYGDTDFTAYSAKLYASFAQNLVAGGTVAVGNALVAAKQQYLAGTPQLERDRPQGGARDDAVRAAACSASPRPPRASRSCIRPRPSRSRPRPSAAIPAPASG